MVFSDRDELCFCGRRHFNAGILGENLAEMGGVVEFYCFLRIFCEYCNILKVVDVFSRPKLWRLNHAKNEQ